MNTDTLQKNRTRLLPALFILLTAVLLMCVVTQSSPLYPLNGWVDSQCFFTVGKSMAAGQVLYRDVYEQKGPLLLGLHAAASLVQRDGFLGVWLMQVGAAAVFLAASYKLLRLFGPRWACLGALPFLGAAAYTSVSYVAGDSAEEWCMPLLAVCLYGLVKACMERRPLGLRWAFAAGVLGGCVLWIKYSMLGFFLAWGVAMLVMALRWKGWREALAECGAVLLGAAAATLPWVVYFGVNGALDDWFTAYFYNNLFLYASGAGGPAAVLKKVAQSLWYAMEHNRLQGALLLAGLGCLLPLVRERALRAAAALAGLGPHHLRRGGLAVLLPDLHGLSAAGLCAAGVAVRKSDLPPAERGFGGGPVPRPGRGGGRRLVAHSQPPDAGYPPGGHGAVSVQPHRAGQR